MWCRACGCLARPLLHVYYIYLIIHIYFFFLFTSLRPRLLCDVCCCLEKSKVGTRWCPALPLCNTINDLTECCISSENIRFFSVFFLLFFWSFRPKKKSVLPFDTPNVNSNNNSQPKNVCIFGRSWLFGCKLSQNHYHEIYLISWLGLHLCVRDEDKNKL